MADPTVADLLAQQGLKFDPTVPAPSSAAAPPVDPLAAGLAARGLTVPGLGPMPVSPRVQVPQGPPSRAFAPTSNVDLSGMAPMTDEQARKAGFAVTTPTMADLRPPVAAPVPSLVFNRPQGAGAGGMGGGGMPPNPYAAYFKAREGEKGAYRNVERAEENASDNEGVANALKGQELAYQQAEIQQKAADRDAEIGRQMGKLDDLSRDAASAKIDPDRWYKKQSTLQSLGWSIAAAFGGAAQGWNHGAGGNPALEAMKAHVDNDIAAQREAIESKRGAVADQKGILGETYRRFGNMEQAETAARILSLQKLDSQAASYAANSKSEGVQAKYGLINAQLTSEIEKEKASLAAQAARTAAANPKGLGEYGEKLDKAGVPDAVSRLKRLEEIYSGKEEPEGTSSMSLLAGKNPATARFLSQKARENQADIEQAVLSYAKATGRVNENEVAMVRSALQGAAPNSAAVRHMLTNMRSDLAARTRNIDASTDPNVIAAYRSRGGTNTDALIAPPSKPPPGFQGAGQ